MKKFILALLPFLLIACASKKGATAFIDGEHTIESWCPPEGDCKFEIMKDKSLIIKTDGTGKLYYLVNDTPGRIVAKYVYIKKSGAYQDDGYREEIIFETDARLSDLVVGNNIKNTKMLFGVHCFCREKAGFYKVNEGTVSYSNETLHLRIPNNIIDQQQINMFTVRLAK
ncbi:hypothetical protein HYN59_05655 [Flavobacterium album]|uniref:Lipoprotein n=1 Tax=Flavobacterium album TaxID=2175091 RepID=A0A2S1QW74_9FLAO|nr:hypothetical protein [Flavobacterium album]AWH84635.1 hypothetical protein HYN59_05655 [Flavobacterium album]